MPLEKLALVNPHIRLGNSKERGKHNLCHAEVERLAAEKGQLFLKVEKMREKIP